MQTNAPATEKAVPWVGDAPPPYENAEPQMVSSPSSPQQPVVVVLQQQQSPQLPQSSMTKLMSFFCLIWASSIATAVLVVLGLPTCPSDCYQKSCAYVTLPDVHYDCVCGSVCKNKTSSTVPIVAGILVSIFAFLGVFSVLMLWDNLRAYMRRL